MVKNMLGGVILAHFWSHFGSLFGSLGLPWLLWGDFGRKKQVPNAFQKKVVKKFTRVAPSNSGKGGGAALNN